MCVNLKPLKTVETNCVAILLIQSNPITCVEIGYLPIETVRSI